MHPVKNGIPIRINKEYAAVKVQRVGKDLTIVPGSFLIAAADTEYVRLPENFKVISDKGIPIAPSGRFLISARTIDPYHLMIDYNGVI